MASEGPPASCTCRQVRLQCSRYAGSCAGSQLHGVQCPDLSIPDRVPGLIKDDHPVGSNQVDAQSASLCAQEDELRQRGSNLGRGRSNKLSS